MRRLLSLSLPVLLVTCSRGEAPPPPEVAGVTAIEVVGVVTQSGAPLAAGDAVDLAKEIVVGEGRAVLQLRDGATLRLYAGTRVRLPQRDRVRLLVGKIWAAITQRLGGGFEVETDNAVAGVRGTEFVVEVSEKRTRVAVVQGEVEVANLDQRQKKRRVAAGQEVTVQETAEPSAPAPFAPQAEEEAWEELSGAAAPEAVVPEEPGPGEPSRRPRPKNRMEREGEETKRRLIKEGEQTKRRLKEESRAAKKQLEAEEAEMRRKNERDAQRAKEGGSVKDFLR